MHVLTKIFVVLVSLLAVMIVPLVVVYAYNENSYKTMYDQVKAEMGAASATLREVEAGHAAEIATLQSQLNEMDQARSDLARQAVEAQAGLRQLESEVAASQMMQAENGASLVTLSAANKVSQDVTSSLVNEVRTLRTSVLALERQKIELDDALRDVNGQLEVAVQARRALQEELQRVKDELAQATTQLGEAIAMGFNPQEENVRVGVFGAEGAGIAPSINLDTTIINVRRDPNQTLAEVDAGSLDGIRPNWILNVARGGSFKGKLRILTVDVNRSTGIVMMENQLQGRTVEVGDTAYARVGQN